MRKMIINQNAELNEENSQNGSPRNEENGSGLPPIKLRRGKTTNF
jgi:hypothetical protein